jgi:ribosomal protein S27E
MTSCLIRCLHCGDLIAAPIQFGSAGAFFSSTLVGSTIRCPTCGRETDMNKENMIFRATTEGFVGEQTDHKRS